MSASACSMWSSRWGDFLVDVDAEGSEVFAEAVLKNRQRTSPRGGILKADAARRFAGALVDARVERYADLLALFADDARLAVLEERLRGVRGNGNGDVRLGYLWMLLGDDDTVKPDRRVLRWPERVLGRPVRTGEARELIAGAATRTGVTPWELDHAVWNVERGGRRRVDSDPSRDGNDAMATVGKWRTRS